MFRADLNLDPVALSGLTALDERRRLRLADAATLSTHHRGDYLRRPVSEGFARAHAASYADALILNFHVAAALLTPDDVRLNDKDQLVINPEMSDARFTELCRLGRVGDAFN